MRRWYQVGRETFKSDFAGCVSPVVRFLSIEPEMNQSTIQVTWTILKFDSVEDLTPKFRTPDTQNEPIDRFNLIQCNNLSIGLTLSKVTIYPGWFCGVYIALDLQFSNTGPAQRFTDDESTRSK